MKVREIYPMDKTKEQFIAAREKRDLTQREWAKLLKVSYSSVTKWESDAHDSKPPGYIMREIREMDRNPIFLDLDEETQKRLSKKLAASGQTVEEYLAGLLKAILTVALLAGGAWVFLA